MVLQKYGFQIVEMILKNGTILYIHSKEIRKTTLPSLVIAYNNTERISVHNFIRYIKRKLAVFNEEKLKSQNNISM